MVRILAGGEVKQAIDALFPGFLEEFKGMFAGIDNDEPLIRIRQSFRQTTVTAIAAPITNSNASKLRCETMRIRSELAAGKRQCPIG